MNSDSVALLKECNSGCKMATESMKQVLSYTEDGELRKLINENLAKHRAIGDKCHIVLNQSNEEEKDPSMMASAFSKMSTGMKLTMENNPTQIAKILLNGCNMGIESLTENMHKYSRAEGESVGLTRDLIEIEQKMGKDLLQFL